MKNIPISAFEFTIPEMKQMILRAICSKNKTAPLMPLPNFALMFLQKFFPRSRNPIHIMPTPLVWLKTAIFWGLAPPWTILLVPPLSSIVIRKLTWFYERIIREMSLTLFLPHGHGGFAGNMFLFCLFQKLLGIQITCSRYLKVCPDSFQNTQSKV